MLRYITDHQLDPAQMGQHEHAAYEEWYANIAEWACFHFNLMIDPPDMLADLMDASIVAQRLGRPLVQSLVSAAWEQHRSHVIDYIDVTGEEPPLPLLSQRRYLTHSAHIGYVRDSQNEGIPRSRGTAELRR